MYGWQFIDCQRSKHFKKKKDRVAMIVQDYEEKMARDAFKKRITDGKENKVIDMTP